MNGYWSEKYQLGIVTHYLRERNISYSTEANLYSIPIDIIGTRNNTTYSIELKTRDFKRGINQAERNTSFVDYSYLSVWDEFVTDGLINRVETSPIGLFAVASGVKCLSTPKRNNPSNYAKSKVKERVVGNVRK